MEEISHVGSLSTRTDFKLKCGKKVRVSVWLSTECTSANQTTYYNCNVSTKGKGCRNWNFEFESKTSKDERILSLITEQQLYTAYFNHWSKLNPIRLFSNGQINGEFVNFTVGEKILPKKHFAY